MQPLRGVAAVRLFVAVICLVTVSQSDAVEPFRVSPARVVLDNPESSQQLLVTARNQTP